MISEIVVNTCGMGVVYKAGLIFGKNLYSFFTLQGATNNSYTFACRVKSFFSWHCFNRIHRISPTTQERATFMLGASQQV